MLFQYRSSKSDYREHHPSSKGFSDLGLQDEFVEHHRGFSPRRAPVIVEHDHGIVKQDSRNHDPLKTSGYSRNRDPPRPSETQRNREPHRDRRDQGHHTRTLQDRHPGRPNNNPREESRKNYSSYGGESQARERPRHMDQSRMDQSRMEPSRMEPSRMEQSRMEQSRMESHSRDSDRRREMNLRDVSDIDLRNRERGSVHEWEEERPQRNHGRMTGQEEVRQRAPYHRNRNTNVGPAPRMDFSEQETLKIKVDMSRPVGQSRYSIIVIPHLVRVKSSCLFSCPLSPSHEDLKNDNLQILKDKKIQ